MQPESATTTTATKFTHPCVPMYPAQVGKEKTLVFGYRAKEAAERLNAYDALVKLHEAVMKFLAEEESN